MIKMTKKIMSYVRQQRMNEVQILVISESIFYPPTMNFAFGTFLCNLMDFRQFTADSSKNKARFKHRATAVPSSILIELNSTLARQ